MGVELIYRRGRCSKRIKLEGSNLCDESNFYCSFVVFRKIHPPKGTSSTANQLTPAVDSVAVETCGRTCLW